MNLRSSWAAKTVQQDWLLGPLFDNLSGHRKIKPSQLTKSALVKPSPQSLSANLKSRAIVIPLRLSVAKPILSIFFSNSLPPRAVVRVGSLPFLFVTNVRSLEHWRASVEIDPGCPTNFWRIDRSSSWHAKRDTWLFRWNSLGSWGAGSARRSPPACHRLWRVYKVEQSFVKCWKFIATEGYDGGERVNRIENAFFFLNLKIKIVYMFQMSYLVCER